MPGTPRSLTSDSVPETSHGFDFDTDVDCLSTDSEYEPNDDEAEVISSLEDDLRQWATDKGNVCLKINHLCVEKKKPDFCLFSQDESGKPFNFSVFSLIFTPVFTLKK